MRKTLLLLALVLPTLCAENVWQITPLVTKKTPAPESAGTFLDFGETYVSDGFISFWARFGPNPDNDWALYSWKDGRVTRIAMHDVDFTTPDSRKDRIMHTPRFFRGGTSLLHAGRRFLYHSAGAPDHLYGWDGDAWKCVLCDGDTLDVGGVAHKIHRAHVLDTDSHGRALVYWDSSRPKANGWAIHDGNTWTPVFKEGEPVPGMTGVTIKNLSSGLFCLTDCLPEPRLLDDGTILGILTVTGAPFKTALFRLSGPKAEKVLAEDELLSVAGKPVKVRLGRLLDANATSLAMDFPEVTIAYYTSAYSIKITETYRPRLLVLDQGQPSFVEEFGLREFKALRGGEFRIDSAVFPTPGSSALLFTVRAARGKSGFATWTLRSFPGLYYWNGKTTLPVEWEKAAGLTLEAVPDLLQRKLSRFFSLSQAYGISLSPVTAHGGGVRVDLPPLGSVPRVWLFPSGASEPKLVAAPHPQAGDAPVSETDILAWKSPDEAIARSDEGLFLLRRAAK